MQLAVILVNVSVRTADGMASVRTLPPADALRHPRGEDSALTTRVALHVAAEGAWIQNLEGERKKEDGVIKRKSGPDWFELINIYSTYLDNRQISVRKSLFQLQDLQSIECHTHFKTNLDI